MLPLCRDPCLLGNCNCCLLPDRRPEVLLVSSKGVDGVGAAVPRFPGSGCDIVSPRRPLSITHSQRSAEQVQEQQPLQGDREQEVDVAQQDPGEGLVRAVGWVLLVLWVREGQEARTVGVVVLRGSAVSAVPGEAVSAVPGTAVFIFPGTAVSAFLGNAVSIVPDPAVSSVPGAAVSSVPGAATSVVVGSDDFLGFAAG